MGIDDETQQTFTLLARRGLLRPLVLFFGAKQGPSTFQSIMDSTFGHVKGDEGEDFHAIFIDDCNISTEAFDGDTDDMVIERHIRHLEIFLEAAMARRIQFKLGNRSSQYLKSRY